LGLEGEKLGPSPLCQKCGLWSEKNGLCKRGGCHTLFLYREGRLTLEQASELRRRYGQFYRELNEFLRASEKNRRFFKSKQGREVIMRPKEEIDDLLMKYLAGVQEKESSNVGES